jgi:hypothetical protein
VQHYFRCIGEILLATSVWLTKLFCVAVLLATSQTHPSLTNSRPHLPRPTADEHIPPGALLFWQVDPQFHIFQVSAVALVLLSESTASSVKQSESALPSIQND